jgi:hypothetical protein
MKSPIQKNVINVQFVSKRTCKRKILLKIIIWYAYTLYPIIKNSFCKNVINSDDFDDDAEVTMSPTHT